MSIYKKLFEAKKEIGKISKDSTNPFYSSKYFDINQLLEHVEPILQKHGLLLLQPICEGKVESRIYDIEDSTDVIYSELQLTNQTDPQKRGSEITYYRRYTLASLLGLQAEDDDANKTKQIPPQDDTPVSWMTENQLKKAIDGGKETIQQAIDWYDGKTIRDGKKYLMKKTYKEQLTNLLTK